MITFINELAQPVLMIVLPTLATVLTAYIFKLWQTQKTKLNKEQWLLLNWSVNTAVWGVEQAYKAGVIPKEMRLEKATEYVQNIADRAGMKISIAEIVAHIESAIGRELNKEKIVAPVIDNGAKRAQMEK